MLKQLRKEKAWKIGLLQSLLVSVYCGAIATFFSFIPSFLPQRPGYFGFFLMLMLLVSSAAITGSLVFGYPVYLALVEKQIKKSLAVLGFTMLSFTVIITLTISFLLYIF